MAQKIRIIGVPMDLGASRRGVDMGPSALRVAGLQARIKQLGHQVEDIGNISVKQPEEMSYGEIIGGSQRIHDYDLLVKRLREHNLPEDAFQWNLDLRRYGSVPHSGFGMGLERTVAWICGAEHIREVIPFPRMLYRVYP